MSNLASQYPQVQTDALKQALWHDFSQGKASRVPVRISTNNRVVVLNEQWNPEGYDFARLTEDAEAQVLMNLRHQLYRYQVIHRYSDGPTELPDTWSIEMEWYNVIGAAMLGAPIAYVPNQVPDTRVILCDGNRDAVFDLPIDQPMSAPFMQQALKLWHEMEAVCKDYRFEGRPVRLTPWSPIGTDGPVTQACNLRGSDFLMDLIAEPEYADRLMAWIVDAAIYRRRAIIDYFNLTPPQRSGFADDSCQMLSPAMYSERILPLHRRFFEEMNATTRTLHMCGDATHLFKIIADALGVTVFDTGFPVDHGWLRETLGPEIEIQGGPEVSLLLNGTAERVYERTREILQSGVMTGRRFLLREGNNLPPNVPEANLAAMYAAALEFGQYD